MGCVGEVDPSAVDREINGASDALVAALGLAEKQRGWHPECGLLRQAIVLVAEAAAARRQSLELGEVRGPLGDKGEKGGNVRE
jgi:hypothetical protein